MNPEGKGVAAIPALPQLPLCILMLAAGFTIIRLLSKKEMEG